MSTVRQTPMPKARPRPRSPSTRPAPNLGRSDTLDLAFRHTGDERLAGVGRERLRAVATSGALSPISPLLRFLRRGSDPLATCSYVTAGRAGVPATQTRRSRRRSSQSAHTTRSRHRNASAVAVGGATREPSGDAAPTRGFFGDRTACASVPATTCKREALTKQTRLA